MREHIIAFILAIFIFILSKIIVITHTYVVHLTEEQAKRLGNKLKYGDVGSQQTVDCGKGKKIIIKIE